MSLREKTAIVLIVAAFLASSVVLSADLALVGTIGPAPAVLETVHPEILLVGGWDGVLRLLDLETLEERKALIVSDSRIVAIITVDAENRSYVFSEDGSVAILTTGDDISFFEIHRTGYSIRSADFDTRESHIILGTTTGDIIALDSTTGERVWETKVHDRGVHSIRILREKGYGFSLSYDGVMACWDTKHGQVKYRKDAEAFTPGLVLMFEEAAIAHVKGGSSVVLRCMHTGEETARIIAGSNIRTISELDGGSTIVLGLEGGLVEYWDLDTLDRLFFYRAHDDHIISLISDTGRNTLATGGSDNSVRLWSSLTDTLIATNQGHTWYISSLEYCDILGVLVSGSFDNTAGIWDIHNRTSISSLEHGVWAVTSVAVDSDGKRVFSGDAGGTIRVWNIKGGFLEKKLRGHLDRVKSLVFIYNEDLLVSSSWDNTIRIWDLNKGEEKAILKYHTGSVNDIDVSPDGKWLLSGSSDGNIVLWSMYDQEVESVFERSDARVHSVRFSDDGTRFAAGYSDGAIGVFEQTGRLILLLEGGHESWVNGIVFMSEDRLLVTGSQDGNVRIWDSEDLTLLSSVKGHPGGVRTIALAERGSLIISGGGWLDSTVKIWSID